MLKSPPLVATLSDSMRMSPCSWGDIFTWPLRGDRIIGLRHEQNLRLCGCNSVWYVASSYDAGVPPASFCVNGSQGWPPCDPNLSQPLSNHRSLTSRVASAAGRLRSDAVIGHVELSKIQMSVNPTT